MRLIQFGPRNVAGVVDMAEAARGDNLRTRPTLCSLPLHQNLRLLKPVKHSEIGFAPLSKFLNTLVNLRVGVLFGVAELGG